MEETLRRYPEMPVSLSPAPDHWNNFLASDASIVYDQEEMIRLPTEKFLGHIDKLVVDVITSEGYHNKETGYISDEAWKRLVDGGMLAPFLDERSSAGKQKEVMQIGRILSYYDLHLGLAYGIVGELGIVPIQRYGSATQQEEFLGIVKEGGKIGFGVTEFRSGTAALYMDSEYEIHEGDVTVSFSKHLQGHSGEAGLIMAVRKKDTPMTVALIFVPQEYIDTKIIETQGLRGIRYGENTGEVTLDAEKYLLVEFSKGMMREFQDLFTKSRLFFIGMTLGHQERMEFEANNYAAQREIGEIMQNELLVVRRTLHRMKARRIAVEAMLNSILELDVVGGDTTGLVAQADIFKSLPAEYAVLSAQDRAGLAGGGSYYPDRELQDYIDIWPFQIFEGPAPFLNTQIGSHLLRRFKNAAGDKVPSFSNTDQYANFLDFFERSISQRELFNGPLTVQYLEYEAKLDLLKIEPGQMPDDLKEVMGRIISRMFALGCLDQIKLDHNDLAEVRSMLNNEIRVEMIEFNGRRKNPFEREQPSPEKVTIAD
ncbi:acyl-CoA/acyl-ACP dehydrogenase [Patescibacteria group bacterium]|nr:acyl-CoA/acyl-ACP dehydrogenase [Patescibacteria group bacterium]